MKPDLRRLLSQHGSYPAIAAAAAAHRLPHFPVTLFAHVGDVYGRVETAAGDDCPDVVPLRLTALVHEEAPASLPMLLDGAGLGDLGPTVAVIGAFGRIWKVRDDDAVRTYVEHHRPYLPSLLLFEVAHEGRPTASMEQAADLAGLRSALTRWSARLDLEARRSRAL